MSAPTPNPSGRESPAAPGSEACGCCEGAEVQTPLAIENRSGLPSITYRVGDYARFRESLHAALAASRLGTRDTSDFTLGLVDAFACAADVFTFYQERLANESYLGSAVERVSLQELSKLVGHRLQPGVAAETWLAFALETPPEQPAELASEPGSFVTGVPSRVSLPAGIRIQSIPGPGESPQTFETVEALDEARPEWNGMRPWLDRFQRPKRGDTFTYLQGGTLNLQRGDLLIFVRPSRDFFDESPAWDFAVIETVDVDLTAERTRVGWKRPLLSFGNELGPTAFSPIEAYVLRRRAAVFGHNAPSPLLFPPELRAGLGLVNGDWNLTLSPTPALGAIDLDGVYPDVLADGWVVLGIDAFAVPGIQPLPVRFDPPPATSSVAREAPAIPVDPDGPEPPPPESRETPTDPPPAPGTPMVGLFLITGVAEVSRADFALSGKVSRLRLRPQTPTYNLFRTRVRETNVFVASERLALAKHPVTDPVQGNRVPVSVPLEGLTEGRRIIVRGTRIGDGTAFVAQARIERVNKDTAELIIHPPLASGVQLQRESVVVHANVAPASHGETVAELLGQGDAGAVFQRFEIRQQPLTYRSSENEIGARPEITLRVNDVAWEVRRTLYDASPTDHAYTLETTEQGRLFAAFGDGVHGSRLPSGVNNLRVSYRTGLGAEGNVAAGQLSQLLTRPLGVKSATNPLRAAGGTDAERVEDARKNIPTQTRTLGRVVSILDYADFACAFAGIAKAQASVLSLPSGPTVAVTIAAPEGAPLGETSPVWRNLLGALRANGDPFVPLRLLAASVRAFRISLRVKIDGAYEQSRVYANIAGRLGDRYAFEARGLGRPVHGSEVIAIAQGTPGVVAATLAALHLAGEAPSLTEKLPAAGTRLAGGQAWPAELLVLAAEGVRLEVLP